MSDPTAAFKRVPAHWRQALAPYGLTTARDLLAYSVLARGRERLTALLQTNSRDLDECLAAVARALGEAPLKPFAAPSAGCLPDDPSPALPTLPEETP